MIVNGKLNCLSITYPEIHVAQGAAVTTTSYIGAKSAIIDGTAAIGEYFKILYGSFSGSGTLVFKSKQAGGNLQFASGAAVASDSGITLKADAYTPATGDLLISKYYYDGTTPDKLENLERLQPRDGYDSFVPSGILNGSNYNYTLKHARTMTLNDKAIIYTGSPIAIDSATGISPALDTGEEAVYTYYPASSDRDADTNGTTTAPTNSGTYYVRAAIAESSAYVAVHKDATLTIIKAAGPPRPCREHFG